MNICLISWYADQRGGADVYTKQLALGLADRGLAVTLVCYDASIEVDARCRVVRIPKPTHNQQPFIWQFATALLSIHWSKHLSQVDGPAPDLVICSSALCQNGIVKKFPGVPWLYFPHARVAPEEALQGLADRSPRLFRWLTHRAHWMAERAALLKAAATVRFTPGAAQVLIDYYRLSDRVRFEIIPAAIAPPSVEHTPPGQELRLLAVGRLVPTKNLVFLLRTLAALKMVGWHLDIVGEGPERESILDTIASCGLGNRVTLRGHHEDVSPFYASADLLVFPSRLESFGLVTLEAMSYGVPALVIRSDGTKYKNVHHEIITDGVDGMIADNEVHFAQRLRKCIEDPNQTRLLAHAARKTATKHYWPVVLDRWEDLFAKITTERNSASETSTPAEELK